MIEAYKTVAASGTDGLDQQVAELLVKGWQPHGPIAICKSDTGFILVQAMVMVEPAG